ncbi:serine protease 42-like [Drosophila gunungcola]|uniref:serine protease 42-like n=1 Tax=Drosophila gunungcola TaxID=103775 RepID=UPI0022E1EFC1|nr:serine protease 42-like [Drosophila gunungcola]
MTLMGFLVVLSAFLVLETRGSVQLLEPGCISPKEEGNDNQNIDSAQWIAYLVRQGAYACSGSLITYRFVLTSGHCAEITENLYVRLGHNQSMPQNGKEDIPVMDVFRHPKYETIMANDIALLKLDRSLKDQAKIRPICIILNHGLISPINYTQSFFLFGWRRVEGDIQQIKATLELVPVDRSDIGKTEYWCRNQEERFCCNNPEISEHTADPGSPLGVMVDFESTQAWAQFGIFSSGHGDTSYGIYTDIYAYSPWIIATIEQN